MTPPTDPITPSASATQHLRVDPAGALYFVSDIHLGGSSRDSETEKEERLLTLLERVEAESGSLYILGDLFDFWFEYKTVIPRAGFNVLARLDASARAGTPIRYVGGNHDFWMENFLRSETAIEVLEDGTVMGAQGLRLKLYHGDGLGPGDNGYKFLKRVFRNPLAIRLFRWIHPDLGIPLALSSSNVSRDHTSGHQVDVDSIYQHVALPALETDADAVLMGHHHVAVHRTTEAGQMMILGDWFRSYTCARLQNGTLTLLEWPLDKPARDVIK